MKKIGITLLIIFELFLTIYVFQVVNFTTMDDYTADTGLGPSFDYTPFYPEQVTIFENNKIDLNYIEYPNLGHITLNSPYDYESLDQITVDQSVGFSVNDYQDENLPDMSNIKTLTSFSIHGKNLKAFPNFSDASNITSLNLTDTSITNIPSLKEYNSLQIFEYPMNINTIYNIETIPTYTLEDGEIDSPLTQLNISSNTTKITQESYNYIIKYDIILFGNNGVIDPSELEVV